jgi:1-acylglycerone phosphate reductase
MAPSKRSVLITGCSDGGLGAALAIAFHDAGFHVYATARNPSKMSEVKARGIETLTLDVLSASSIAACVEKVPSLDILVNNAGGGYSMPVADIDLTKAKELFDLNVWSYIAVTQAFLPFILKSKSGMIVNQTSVAASCTVPWQSTYNASKAAIATFSDSQRLELAPFGIKVVDLKTGVVVSNLAGKLGTTGGALLPKGSIYEPAREVVESALRAEEFQGQGMAADQWAKAVVADLSKSNPPAAIWRGEQAWIIRLGTLLPHGTLDGMLKKVSKLDVVEKIMKV